MDLRHKIYLAIEYAKNDYKDAPENWRSFKGMADAMGISDAKLRERIDNEDFSFKDLATMQQYLGDGFNFEVSITLPDGTKL